MLIDIPSKTLRDDFADMLSGMIITGYYKFKGRKHKLRSVIGKGCGRKLANSLAAYLTAWEVKL